MRPPPTPFPARPAPPAPFPVQAPAPPYATPPPGSVQGFGPGAPLSPAQLAHQHQPGPAGSRTFSTLEGWGAPDRPATTTSGRPPQAPVEQPPRTLVWIAVLALAIVVGIVMAFVAA